MNKIYIKALLLSFTMIFFTGCASVGDKSANLSIVYGVTAALSLLLLIGYCSLIPKKDIWFLLLFTSVLVVNIGYFALAISKSLEEALLANRIAYLGSVFLPFSMQMIILNVTKIQYKKWLPFVLLGISVFVFLIAASPGYLDIYYKDVSFEIINGVSILRKTYGTWHSLYLFYLLGYFSIMIISIIHATIKKKLYSTAHVIVLISAVGVNIGVWLIEQLVSINFEILSVSYIITELFLLGLNLLIQEKEKQNNTSVSEISSEDNAPKTSVAEKTDAPVETEPSDISEEVRSMFLTGLAELTPTERLIYEAYIIGTSTKDIMRDLNIKENTLKYHNKNLYSKLGVSSRKQLMHIHKHL